MDYFFERQQPLKFLVLDIDNAASKKMEDQDYIGEFVTSLGEIVGSRGGTIIRDLINSMQYKGAMSCCIDPRL